MSVELLVDQLKKCWIEQGTYAANIEDLPFFKDNERRLLQALNACRMPEQPNKATQMLMSMKPRYYPPNPRRLIAQQQPSLFPVPPVLSAEEDVAVYTGDPWARWGRGSSVSGRVTTRKKRSVRKYKRRKYREKKTRCRSRTSRRKRKRRRRNRQTKIKLKNI